MRFGSVSTPADALAANSPSAPAPATAAIETTARQIRGSTLLLIGRILALGIAFLVQVLLVRYLSKDSYGSFAYVLSLVIFAQTILTFGLDRAVTRFIPIYEERGAYEYVLGTLAVVLATFSAITLAAFLIVYGFHDSLAHWLSISGLAKSLLPILVILAPLQAVDDLLTGLFSVYSRPRAIFFRRYLVAPGLRLVVVVLLVLAQTGPYFLSVGYVLAGAVGTAVYAWMLLRTLRRLAVWQRLSLRPRFPVRELFAFTIPLLSTDLLYATIGLTDVVLLAHYRDSAAVGALRAVQPVAALNQVAFSSFLILFTPVIARHFARDDKDAIQDVYWQTARWIAIATLPVFLVTLVLARPVTVAFFGERYAGSASVLAVLSLGYYIQVAFGFNGTTLMVFGRLRYIVSLNAAGVVVNVLLNLFLVPRYGAVGAAAGTTGTLVAHNLLKQLGLWRGAGIGFAVAGTARFYTSIVVAVAASFYAVRVIPTEPAQFAVVALAALAVLRVNRRALRIAQTFPELIRIPGARYLLGD